MQSFFLKEALMHLRKIKRNYSVPGLSNKLMQFKWRKNLISKKTNPPQFQVAKVNFLLTKWQRQQQFLNSNLQDNLSIVLLWLKSQIQICLRDLSFTLLNNSKLLQLCHQQEVIKQQKLKKQRYFHWLNLRNQQWTRRPIKVTLSKWLECLCQNISLRYDSNNNVVFIKITFYK